MSSCCPCAPLLTRGPVPGSQGGPFLESGFHTARDLPGPSPWHRCHRRDTGARRRRRGTDDPSSLASSGLNLALRGQRQSGPGEPGGTVCPGWPLPHLLKRPRANCWGAGGLWRGTSLSACLGSPSCTLSGWRSVTQSPRASWPCSFRRFLSVAPSEAGARVGAHMGSVSLFQARNPVASPCFLGGGCQPGVRDIRVLPLSLLPGWLLRVSLAQEPMARLWQEAILINCCLFFFFFERAEPPCVGISLGSSPPMERAWLGVG